MLVSLGQEGAGGLQSHKSERINTHTHTHVCTLMVLIRSWVLKLSHLSTYLLAISTPSPAGRITVHYSEKTPLHTHTLTQIQYK